MTEWIIGFIAVLLVITAIIWWIAKLMGKTISAYKVFGIVDAVFIVIIIIMAVVDIVTPGGDLNGILGTVLLLIFGIPAVVCLIVDYILYIKIGKNDTKENE